MLVFMLFYSKSVFSNVKTELFEDFSFAFINMSKNEFIPYFRTALYIL